MSKSNQIFFIKKDSETIRKTVLTNILKMLCNRKWINSENLNDKIDKIINEQNDNHVYIINLDVDLKNVKTFYPVDDGVIREFADNYDGKTIAVKLLPQKITSIGKSPIIQEFFNYYKKCHKILIVESISVKSKMAISNMKGIEIFSEPYFMLDMMEIVCSPEYEILEPEETIKFLENNHLTRKQMKKIFDNDPASQYFFLKAKQIVRIIRNSEMTGKSVDYRLVVHKNS
jgi:DNA-directed RNA polymerase subunit H (RpoH/RPB5)